MHQHQASPDNIDITSLFSAVRRSLGKVLIASLAAGTLTFLALSMIAPQYISQSELTISAKGTANPFTGPRTDGTASEILASRIDKEAVNTHVRAIQSPDIAAEIATKFKLSRLREFNSALGPQDLMGRVLKLIGLDGNNPNRSERDRVLGAYFDRLEVFSPKESRIITIGFSSSDSQLAADIANQVAEDYRARLAKVTVVETDVVQKALAPKIAKLTQEVAVALADVATFRSSAGLLRGGAQKTPLNQQQLGELTAELTRASAAVSALQASATTARDLIRRGNPEVIPQVQRSPLIQNLIQQRVLVQRDFLKFSATMKSAHPVIRQLSADLRAVKRQIALEVANVVASLDKEAQVAVAREASISRSLDAIKVRVADKSGDEVKLSGLEAVAKSKHAELARLQAQYEANRARADSGVVPVEAEIVSVAQPASVPSRPRKGPYAALVMAAVFLFGLAWSITSAILTAARTQPSQANPIREDITAVAGKLVPEFKGQMSPGAAHGQVVAEIKVFKNAPALAGHLLKLSSATNAGHRTMIVAPEESETASKLTKDLASEFTRNKRNTLVIDWSTQGEGVLAKPTPADQPGMMQLLNGEASFADVVRALPGTATHMISTGAALADGATLDADKLNLILDALDEAYDQIVVVANSDEAKILFETIQGRVDVGITVNDKIDRPKAQSQNDQPGTFLGFNITDIHVIRFAPARDGQPKGRRLFRASLPQSGKHASATNNL